MPAAKAILLRLVLLGGVTIGVGLLAADGPERWAWPVPVTVALCGIFTTVVYAGARRWLLRDCYGPMEALRALVDYNAYRQVGCKPSVDSEVVSHETVDQADYLPIQDAVAECDLPHLTKRELIVLRYLVEGLTNGRIAETLGRSERT